MSEKLSAKEKKQNELLADDEVINNPKASKFDKWLAKTDKKAEEKSSFVKFLWQLFKFIVVSGLVSIIQIALAYLLPFIFDKAAFKVGIPGFLRPIFNPVNLFDVNTAAGMKSIDKYVVGGITTWGYILPFFLSNTIANIYGYIQNKKRTFRSDAPKISFVIYIILLVALMLFSTWLQGFVYGKLTLVDNSFISGASRLIATAVAGFIQFVVLFPMEKFVLLKEKKD